MYVSILFLLVDVVVQKFDDQVNVSQNHASAAVAFAAELVEGFPCGHAILVNQL